MALICAIGVKLGLPGPALKDAKSPSAGGAHERAGRVNSVRRSVAVVIRVTATTDDGEPAVG